MKQEDLGSILIILTWITPLIYIIYYLLQGIGFGTYSLIQKIGKEPLLFIIDLILFYIGLILISKNLDKNKAREFLNYLYLIPIINVLISGIYASSIIGFPDGMKIFIDGMFISMYNLLILTTLLLIDLNTKMNLTKFFINEKGALTVIAEFIIFGVLRYFYGPSFIIMLIFIIVIPVSIYILYR